MDALTFLIPVGAVCAFLASLWHYVGTLDAMDYRTDATPYWRFLAVGLGRIGLCVSSAAGTLALLQGSADPLALMLVASVGLLSIGKRTV